MMNDHYPDDFELNHRLDRAAPPHTREIGEADVDPLVGAARRLAQGPDVGLSRATLDRIEARLQAQMDTLPLYQVQTYRNSRRRPRVLPYAAAIALVFFLSVFAVGRAAAASLPGDRLYPVKRMMERVQIALVTKESKAALHIKFATKRADEFEALLEQDQVYPRALEDTNHELKQALTLLEEGHGDWSAVEKQVDDLTKRESLLVDQAQSSADAVEQARLNAVSADYDALQQRIEAMKSPDTPSIVPTVVVTATALPTLTSTPIVTATTTPRPTLTPTPTITATATAQPTLTPTPTVMSTVTATVTPQPTLTPTPTLIATVPLHAPTDVPLQQQIQVQSGEGNGSGQGAENSPEQGGNSPENSNGQNGSAQNGTGSGEGDSSGAPENGSGQGAENSPEQGVNSSESGSGQNGGTQSGNRK